MKLVIEIPDDLLETQFFCQYFGVWSTKLQETFMNGFQLVDNPENEAYQQGYTDGWKERFGEPDRPRGMWIVTNKSFDFADMECSKCHVLFEDWDTEYPMYPFCPQCGSYNKMEEGEAE